MAAVERTLVAADARSDAALIIFTVVSFVWLGALLGVSFLATPVKFLAPSLTLPVALDVGRQTFHWFNRVEVVLGAVMLISALAYELPALRRPRRSASRPAGVPLARNVPYATWLGGLLTAAAVLQAVWLLPVLDARVEVIIQGGMPSPSSLHELYILIEAVKLGALVGAGWLGMSALRRGAARAEG